MQDLCKQAGDAGVAVIKRLAPFGLQLVASAAAYSAGLGLFQVKAGLGLGSPKERLACISVLTQPIAAYPLTSHTPCSLSAWACACPATTASSAPAWAAWEWACPRPSQAKSAAMCSAR